MVAVLTAIRGEPHSSDTMNTHGAFSKLSRMGSLFAGPFLQLMTVALPVHAEAPPVPANSPAVSLSVKPTPLEESVGDAWSDPNNPIVQRFEGRRLDLWSLQKPQRPALPLVKREEWVRTPIDAFILAKLEKKQLAPSPPADRHTLIRRLYFDLIGLPPSPQEVAAFINDSSPDAYEQLVDRLLTNPQYGVRWARHWLDVVRYADTNGFERDEFRPTQYHYRDYVVRAFNNDKPFDTFIREQLAGDELPPAPNPPRNQAEVDQLIATGYLRLGPYDTTGAIFGEDRKGHDQLMADLVNTTAEAFLGLTLTCANCHDHKYDPISQADHFRMRAFFAAVEFHDDMLIDTSAMQDEINNHNAPVEAKIAELQQQIGNLFALTKKKLAAERRAKFTPEIQELLETDEVERDEPTKDQLKPFVEQLNISDDDALAALLEADRQRHDDLATQIQQHNNQKRVLATALGMTDAGATAPATHVYFQGDYTHPLDEVSPGFLSVFDPGSARIGQPANADTTGRRTALANWIASSDNPLTARVLMNRLWQHHFDRPLVATPNDFGYGGARPTHPDLLDWLAVEFMQPIAGGAPWSVKGMQRLIVLSAAYRQGNGQALSTDQAAGSVSGSADQPTSPKSDFQNPHSVDPDNILIWCRLPRRLDAETLRDAMLAVSGSLHSTDHGAPVWPEIPVAVKGANPKLLKGEESDGLAGWYTTMPAEESFVRSLFTIQKRSVKLPFLDAFDQPDANCSCARRYISTVAPQALMLLNSPFAVEMANRFADRVATQAGEDSAQRVDATFRFALARLPDEEERATCFQLLQTHTARHDQAKVASPEQAALVDLCRALMNVNEFVYVD